MSIPQRSARTGWSEALSEGAALLAVVLDAGDVDEHSRKALGRLYQALQCGAAALSNERLDEEWSAVARNAEYRERFAAWGRVTPSERERLALRLVGEERLTIAELTERFQAELPDCGIYQGYIRNLVRRLVGEGKLDRVGERWRKGDSIRYRYFRRTRLAGPIAELEQFHDDDQDAGA